MSRVFHVYAKPFERLKLSLFEKVILANSVMLIFVALVGLWITSHNLEAHHYLIDTSFIVLATLLRLLVNVVDLSEQAFITLFNLHRLSEKSGKGTRILAHKLLLRTPKSVNLLKHSMICWIDSSKRVGIKQC